MRRLTIALVGLVLAGAAATIWGCGSTSPSSSVIYTIQLFPANEAPTPVTDSEGVARGTAVITIHKDTNTVDFAVSVNSFPAGSSLIAAHIHGPNAPAGVAAGVLVGTGMTPGNAPALVNGAATFNFNGVAADAGTISQITASPTTFYFNVHSAQHPGGVMRGQLQ
jgi:hypothetical protein